MCVVCAGAQHAIPKRILLQARMQAQTKLAHVPYSDMDLNTPPQTHTHAHTHTHTVRVCLDRNEGSPRRTLESATESQGLQQTRCVVRAEAMGCHRVHRPKDVGHWRDDVIGRREIAVAKRRAQQCSQMRQPAAVALPLPPLKQAPKQAPLPARVLPQQAVCLAEPCAPAAA